MLDLLPPDPDSMTDGLSVAGGTVNTIAFNSSPSFAAKLSVGRRSFMLTVLENEPSSFISSCHVRPLGKTESSEERVVSVSQTRDKIHSTDI